MYWQRAIELFRSCWEWRRPSWRRWASQSWSARRFHDCRPRWSRVLLQSVFLAWPSHCGANRINPKNTAKNIQQKSRDGFIRGNISFRVGDVGQVTAATIAARTSLPFVVWLGAVSAMVTKGTLATFLGAGIRKRIQREYLPKLFVTQRSD